MREDLIYKEDVMYLGEIFVFTLTGLIVFMALSFVVKRFIRTRD